MFDDHTCMAFLISFFFLSFFLSLLNRCRYVCISFLIISFFVVQMLNYVYKLNKITIKLY